MMIKKICFLVALSIVASSINVQAEEVWVIKKQEVKKESRWSLAQWLEKRDRMIMMDLWLAANSPSPFEFYLTGEYQLLNGQALFPSSNGWRVELGAFATIFGLEIDREEIGSTVRYHPQFRLRVFGYHDQGTNLTLEGGMRFQEASDVWTRTPFLGVALTLYVAKYFGVDGHFNYLFAQGSEASGTRFEGGAFIDFSFLRVFGQYLTEGQGSANRQAITLGTRLYF